MMWLPVNSQVQQITPFQISSTRLLLQDEAINLDELTELEDASIFKLDLMPMKPQEKDYNVQMDISIEMNLSQRVVARAGYTFLDYLSDIGGMQGMLISGVAYFLAFWNFNYFDDWMITRLYKMKKRDTELQPGQSTWQRSTFAQPGLMSNPADCICDYFPKFLRCCTCCGPSRKTRYFETAREQLEREINIIEIVKSRRYFAKAFKFLLTK